MNRIILKFLLLIFFLIVNINAKNISINKVDSFKSEKRNLTSKDSISNLIKNGFVSNLNYKNINDFILIGNDTVKLVKDETFINLLTSIDSISRLFNNKDDTIKVILNKSITKNFKSISKIIMIFDTLSNDNFLNNNDPYIVIDKVKLEKKNIITKEDLKKSLLFTVLGIVLILILVLVLKRYKYFKNKIVFLKKEILALNQKNTRLYSKIKDLESDIKDSSDVGEITNVYVYSTDKIEETRIKVIDKIQKENTLNRSQLKMLTDRQEYRWVTVAHSAMGKSHSQANPQIPCQDNYHFETLNDDWQLAIVCDGAGSAKMSHFGSKLISNNAIPSNLKKILINLKWFKNGDLPCEREWKSLIVSIFKETYKNLISWVDEQNVKYKTTYSVNDYASTVILALYNSKGVAVANIGDGRGGYLSRAGLLKPLFTPFRGDESNGTIFLTSPIWEDPHKFIQTDVIKEKLLAIFLLSDGMEKITFECSNLTDDVFTDANIPFKKFFFPVFSKIKLLDNEGEKKLKAEWELLLESGNEIIKNESDDKTLLVSFLK